MPRAGSEVLQSEAASSSQKRQRASKACTRCRRYRTKCRPGPLDGCPPCQECYKQGVAQDCVYKPRGHSQADRSHRRRKLVSQTDTSASPSIPLSSNHAPRAIRHNTLAPLPPEDEVIEAINNYVSSYFQVGFIHKPLFIDKYRQDPQSGSTILLLAICSVAAPFSPSLTTRYGGRLNATCHFLDQADVIIGQEMSEPTLARTQAFLLLGVAQWGQGNGQKAWMLIGIASRMAGFLGLQREAYYHLKPDADSTEIIEMEVSRRTFWSIICHESLLAGQGRPSSFNLDEIDAGLPADESDFNFGIQPAVRSYLAKSRNAVVIDGGVTRSLFSSLVQASILWSLTARHASRRGRDHGIRPWTDESQKLLRDLCEYEANLPAKHRFSQSNLRGMIAEGHDLPFLSLSLLPKLSTIVIRRMYLSSMTAAVETDFALMLAPGGQFWREMSSQMVHEAEDLLSQVEMYIKMRSPTLGFPPVFMFAIFMCGNVFSYLGRWPDLCPDRASHAIQAFHRCKDILKQSSDAWAMGTKWCDTLDMAEANFSRLDQSFRPTTYDEQTLDEDLVPLYGDRDRGPISRLSDSNVRSGHSRAVPRLDDTSPSQGSSSPFDVFVRPDTLIGARQGGPPPQPDFDFGPFFGTFDSDLEALLMSIAPTSLEATMS